MKEVTTHKEIIESKTTFLGLKKTFLTRTVREVRTIYDISGFFEGVKETPLKNIPQIFSKEFVGQFIKKEVVVVSTTTEEII